MVTIEQLYRALRAKGASEIQAAAITGNSVSEVGPSTSDLNPASELNIDYYEPACMGIVCWTTPGYHAPRPTGNWQVDVDAQIDYLKATGGFEHALGEDALAAGRNFALNYERCAECFYGGPQFIARGDQAAAVARLAADYHWDTPAAPKPEPSYRYERFMEGGERTAAERYDHWRSQEKLTRTERAWLAMRRGQCGFYARRVAAVAKSQKVNGKPSWGTFNRGWRYQQLHDRAVGRRVEPTV